MSDAVTLAVFVDGVQLAHSDSLTSLSRLEADTGNILFSSELKFHLKRLLNSNRTESVCWEEKTLQRIKAQFYTDCWFVTGPCGRESADSSTRSLSFLV